MKIKSLIGAVAATAALAMSGQAAAVPVGLELMLLVDVSGSVDSTEYQLQKKGYADAFQDAAVQSAILGSQGGAIAVTYIEWSSASQQAVKVGWSLIDSVASANSFAASINSVTRAFSGLTAIQSAISNTYKLFGTEVAGGVSNGFESLRQVVDVSGDGARNDGIANGVGRDAALAAGVDTINGIVIGNEVGLLAHYQQFVIGGSGAFAVKADSFDDFGTAIKGKLIKEITQVPEPGSIALAGLALMGLVASRRRK